MTKENLPKDYLEWIKEEKNLARNLYTKHKTTVGTGLVPVRHWRTTNRSFFIRIAAAAVLILALGTSLWLKRDAIFKSSPNYTEEQIALSYDQTIRALAVCANSLSGELSQIRKLNQIPESLEEIKTLKTVINN